ncbi:Tn3 family transposase [Streptomyces sp. NPDC054783]
MHKQLTVQQSRQSPARDICRGKRGTATRHTGNREAMKDQLGALGPVLNAVVLWTTRYVGATIAQLRAEGH